MKITPKVDMQDMYNQVWDVLKQNEVVGVFPEGGSHDRTSLLPFKSGICSMALGAMNKYNNDVYIQPVGLNYYKSNAIRSKVIIE